MRVVLEPDETATILAALRFWVERGQCDADNRTLAIHEIATNGGAETSLTPESVDALCERINTGGL